MIIGRRMGGRSLPQVQLIEPLIFLLLVANVGPSHLFITAHRGHKIASRPKMLPDKVLPTLTRDSRQGIALLPFMYPTTCDTAYLGGIESRMY